MWNPEDYAQHSEAQLKWARELRSRLDLQGNESVLDLGCGDGKITADFAATLSQGKVVGVDSSPEMIAYAERTYPTSKYPNLTFACIDARNLDFINQFDLVFSNAVLHWVEDHQAVLEGASRALRGQGRLIISCGGRGNAADVLQVFAAITAAPAWSAYFEQFHDSKYFYDDQDYQPWLDKAGLQTKRLALVPKDMTHVGAAGLAGWIRTTWMPYTNRVPAEDRDRFIQDFINLYLEQIPLDADGLAHVRMVRLEVEAEKD